MSFSGRRRRSREGAGAEGGMQPDFQVAPMADVLFVLLVFFMSITTVEVLRAGKGIDLPQALGGNRAAAAAHILTIDVGWDEGPAAALIRADNQPCAAPADLVPILAARLKADPALRVVIRADRAVEYASIAGIMQACRQAHVATVAFAVKGKE